MRNSNPVIIPNNYYVEEVLAAAEGGDLKPFIAFLDALVLFQQMKIIILGSNGMLGKYMLNSSLFQEEAVIGMSRSSFPSFDFQDRIYQ